MTATLNLALSRSKQHLFFAAAAVLLLAIVVTGFFESYFRAGLLFAHLPSKLVHLHAALYVGWIVLFGAQVSLVATGHVHWHRRLGVALAAWAALMIIVGPFTVIMAVRRPDSGLKPFEFMGDLAQVCAFAVLIGRALLRRRDLLAHKRLMLIGTSLLMLPALARFPAQVPLAAILAIYLSVPLALIGWDLSTLRRVHGATVFGITLVVLVLAATLGIGPTPLWSQFTHWVATA